MLSALKRYSRKTGLSKSEYLLGYLGKRKFILFGSSWGSVPGVSMAMQSPGLFYAYIGHSQIVDPNESFPKIYELLVSLAKRSNDQASLDELARLESASL